MEALVHVVSAHDPSTELRTLRAALLFEEALRGLVEFRSSPHGGSGAGEVLAITLGAPGAAQALTRGLGTWLVHRGPDVRLRVTVDLVPGQVTPAATTDLAALMQPTVGAVAAAVPPAQPPADVAGKRLIERIETSVFSKPAVGRRGYDETTVDTFLDAIIASIRAGKPMDPAEVANVSFRKPAFGKRGYDEADVDALLEEVQRELRTLAADQTDSLH